MLEIKNNLENHWNNNLRSIATDIQDPNLPYNLNVKRTIRLPDQDKEILLEEHILTGEDSNLRNFLSHTIELDKKFDFEKKLWINAKKIEIISLQTGFFTIHTDDEIKYRQIPQWRLDELKELTYISPLVEKFTSVKIESNDHDSLKNSASLDGKIRSVFDGICGDLIQDPLKFYPNPFMIVAVKIDSETNYKLTFNYFSKCREQYRMLQGDPNTPGKILEIIPEDGTRNVKYLIKGSSELEVNIGLLTFIDAINRETPLERKRNRQPNDDAIEEDSEGEGSFSKIRK